MITLSQCFDFTGLLPQEVILGISPGDRHHVLLASYLANTGRGFAAVRDLMIADLRGFLDLGARARAADSLVVLRLFLYDHPQMLHLEACEPDSEP